MLRKLRELFKDEKGEDLVEYALLISFIALLVIGAITYLKDAIVIVYENIADILNPP